MPIRIITTDGNDFTDFVSVIVVDFDDSVEAAAVLDAVDDLLRHTREAKRRMRFESADGPCTMWEIPGGLRAPRALKQAVSKIKKALPDYTSRHFEERHVDRKTLRERRGT